MARELSKIDTKEVESEDIRKSADFGVMCGFRQQLYWHCRQEV